MDMGSKNWETEFLHDKMSLHYGNQNDAGNKCFKGIDQPRELPLRNDIRVSGWEATHCKRNVQ